MGVLLCYRHIQAVVVLAMDQNNNTDDENEAEELEKHEAAPINVANKKLSSNEAKAKVQEFMNEKKADIAMISQSHYASYKNAEFWHEKLINILCCALKKRLKDNNTAASCEVRVRYDQLKAADFPILEISSELSKAVKNASQNKITSFFAKLTRPAVAQRGPAREETSDAENNASKEDTENEHPEEAVYPPGPQRELFRLFHVSPTDANNIKKAIKLDADFVNSKESVKNINVFLSLHTELEKLKAYDRDSKLTEEKHSILHTKQEISAAFQKLAVLCSPDNTPENQSLEEMVAFLKKKSDEANLVARELFLKLNSDQFQQLVKSVSLRIRKRISNIHNTTPSSSQPLKVDCYKAGDTWDSCIESVEADWSPAPNNGYLKVSDFVECRSIFRSMELRGDHFVTSENLLKWLKKTERKSQVIQSLIRNLPLLFVQKDKIQILMSVTAFLQSREMMEDFIEIVKEQKTSKNNKEKEPEINVTPGTVPVRERVQGSGRPSLVDTIPGFLETVKDYCGMAGVAAHSRRRTNVGRTGFSIPDVHSVVKEKLFSSNPEKCPSLRTIRRIFEPPSQRHNNKHRYKSLISALPGRKRNDETARNDGGHPHRHACFSFFRKSR